MRRRGTLGSWILMIALFGGAMALIFYILLLRAQGLASMEQRRTQAPQSQVIELLADRPEPVIYPASGSPDTTIPLRLVLEPAV